MNGKVRALVGATGVSAVVAAVSLSGGTSAFFYDAQHFNNNSITACTLKLAPIVVNTTETDAKTSTVASIPNPDAQSVVIGDLAPGQAFETTYTITNTGSCAGDLYADISSENYQPGSSKNNPLWDAIQMEVKGGTVDYSNTLGLVADHFPAKIATLQPQETITLKADYNVPDHKRPTPLDSGDNLIQGQQLNFDVDFALSQLNVDPTTGENGGPHL